LNKNAPLYAARDYQEWEPIHDMINRKMTPIALEGLVAKFLLHIQDDRTWFRRIGEPFPEKS
jgi:hypothetical protein